MRKGAYQYMLYTYYSRSGGNATIEVDWAGLKQKKKADDSQRISEQNREQLLSMPSKL